MTFPIIVFALAIGVPLAAAAVLWLRLESLRLSVEAQKASISALPSGSATTKRVAKLEDEVAALIVAHEAQAASIRKNFGKLWGTIGHERAPAAPAEPETPEAVRARLRAENDLPRFGNHLNGSK